MFRNKFENELLIKLIDEILKGLNGKIWDGKVKIFNAILNIIKNCDDK